jgi:hypothetical protein
MKKLTWFLFLVAGLAAGRALHATPSTQIWNPSTDIQGLKSWHLGIDNYFSVVDNKTKSYAFPTDVGLTYGLVKNVEVGVDYMGPGADPLMFNAKYGLPEGDMMPAVALGGMNFGTKKTENDAGGAQVNGTDADILYGVAARTFKPVGRFSVGYYSGNDKLLVDEKGATANTGMIATWDKQVTDKVWVAVDYASGRSYYGSLSYGFSYAFAPNTSIIFGYVVYNNQDPAINKNHQFTTQLDINF